jgi:hypothetical protein
MGQHPDESDAAPPDGERDGALNVPDDRLPEDLRPDDDNPLAQPADDDVPEDVLIEGHTGSGGDSGGASEGEGGDSGASSQEAPSETGSATDAGTDESSDG